MPGNMESKKDMVHRVCSFNLSVPGGGRYEGSPEMNCEQQRRARKRVSGEPGTSEERQDSLGKG